MAMQSRPAPWLTRAWSSAVVLGATLALALLPPGTAFADKVALVPARGGAAPADDRAVDAHLAAAVTALGHTLVQEGAEWIVSATRDPAVSTYRLELGASFVAAARFESVARDLLHAQRGPLGDLRDLVSGGLGREREPGRR